MHIFFSLFFVQNELSVRLSSPYLIFPQIYTNTPTWTNQQRDRSVLVLVACRSVLVALDQSSWADRNGSGCLWINVGSGDRCLWVNGNGFWCLWIDTGNGDLCLWVDWNESLHVHMLLWVDACGGDGCLRQLKGWAQVEETWPRGSGD